MVDVQAARALARQWVDEVGCQLPGFAGAFFHGSINWLADTAILPATSDVDIMVVLRETPTAARPGKLRYGELLLEVSYLHQDELASPERVLGLSHLAGSFRVPGIIADPSGQLAMLQAAVARDYARLHWVRARCQHAVDKILGNFAALHEPAPFHDQVAAWLFGTGVTTHVLLAAGLKNPTVRRRYLATRELLADYGLLDSYPPLLELLGCAELGQRRVAEHLDALAEAFDAAKAVIKTPFFFASDISDLGRPVAIDGSRALIERGFHREACFWMVATACRCQKVFYHDAPPALQARFTPGYRALLHDLGIDGPADLLRRSEQVQAFLPALWTLAETIMAANPEIEGPASPE